MDKYSVKFLSESYAEIDKIYGYIASKLLAPEAAERLMVELEKSILSLEELPRRGALRKTGVYANQGYRQLFVNNFTIVYRIEDIIKQVVIVSVRYSKRNY